MSSRRKRDPFRNAQIAPRVDPTGWLVARTPRDANYPCRCAPGCGQKCPCRGRTDLAGLPPSCCARRAAETAARAERGDQLTD